MLRLVDDNLVLVLAFGGMSFGALFVYFWETARLGVRHRCAPMTLMAATVFLAHDGNFVINAEDWWSGYDHWLLKGFWLALVVTTCFELFYLATIVRFGRDETAGRLSQAQWTLACVGAAVAAMIGWGLLKEHIDDPLYLTSFMLTITWCLPSISTLLLRRGVRRGLSLLQVQSYWVMALGYVLLTTIVFDFTAFWWLAVCALTLAWGALVIVLVSRAPAWEAPAVEWEPRTMKEERLDPVA